MRGMEPALWHIDPDYYLDDEDEEESDELEELDSDTTPRRSYSEDWHNPPDYPGRPLTGA